MPYDPEQQQRIHHWLSVKWRGGCPMCSSRRWTVGDLMELEAPNAQPPDFPSLMFVPVTCNDCGFMMQLAATAVALGGPLLPEKR